MGSRRTLKAATPRAASRAMSWTRKGTIAGRLPLAAGTLCWQAMLAWPASMEAMQTPTTPKTGPATGVPQEMRNE